jgi:hypothetical protein
VGPALLALGCGSSGPAYAPVSGVVKLNGKPLANAAVNFQPRAASGNPNPGPGSHARTDQDGRFTLTVVGSDRDGALVGKHRVEISAFDRKAADTAGERPGAQQALKNKVPPQFNDRTTLEFDVPSDGTAAANFDLKFAAR